jgi:hypothetical protein
MQQNKVESNPFMLHRSRTWSLQGQTDNAIILLSSITRQYRLQTWTRQRKADRQRMTDNVARQIPCRICRIAADWPSSAQNIEIPFR